MSYVSTVFENTEAIEGKCSFSFLSNNFDEGESSQYDDFDSFREKFEQFLVSIRSV